MWVLEVAYDPSILAYVSTTTASTFTSAVVVEDATAGALSMSTSGLSSGTTAADVTGSAVSVVDVTFRLLSTVAEATHDHVLSLSVKQMVNGFSIAFATDVVGQVNDERGGAQTSATITVEALDYVGIWAHAPRNELVNEAPLSGVSTATALVVVAAYNQAGMDDAVVSSTASYTLASASDASVVSVFGDGVVAADMQHTRGSPGIDVVISHPALVGTGGGGGGANEVSLATNASFRVWFPRTVTMAVSDDSLGLVLPSSPHGHRQEAVLHAYESSSCTSGPRYQKARASANATFSFAGGGEDFFLVDVTSMVSFISSNTSVADMVESLGTGSASDIYGTRVGTTNISLSLYGPSSSSQHPTIKLTPLHVPVRVSNDHAAHAARLHVVVFTGAAWEELDGGAG